MKGSERQLTKQELEEAIEYYRENAFGFDSVEQFVHIEYAYFGLSDKALAKAVKYIKNHI